MDVTRLQGKTIQGTYVVSIFVEDGKISKVETNGKNPHRSVTELCDYLSKSHTKLCNESIAAIKVTMLQHGEYRGFAKGEA